LQKSDVKFHITVIYEIILKSHGIMVVNSSLAMNVGPCHQFCSLVFLKMFSVVF